jgi:hypothetical protein
MSAATHANGVTVRDTSRRAAGPITPPSPVEQSTPSRQDIARRGDHRIASADTEMSAEAPSNASLIRAPSSRDAPLRLLRTRQIYPAPGDTLGDTPTQIAGTTDRSGTIPTVGYFGTFIFRDGAWQDHGGGDRELVLDIHDSDIATVDYRPAPPGLGRFYLGYQPRDYFSDPDASWPVDAPAEVEAFVGWAEQTLGSAPDPADVSMLLAEDGGVPTEDFVEDSAATLIALLGLPLPPALAEVID